MKKKLFLLMVATCVAVGMAAQSATDIYNAGIRAYKAGNHAEAVANFQKAANMGLAEAQNNLGTFYERGAFFARLSAFLPYFHKKVEQCRWCVPLFLYLCNRFWRSRCLNKGKSPRECFVVTL